MVCFDKRAHSEAGFTADMLVGGAAAATCWIAGGEEETAVLAVGVDAADAIGWSSPDLSFWMNFWTSSSLNLPSGPVGETLLAIILASV